MPSDRTQTDRSPAQRLIAYFARRNEPSADTGRGLVPLRLDALGAGTHYKAGDRRARFVLERLESQREVRRVDESATELPIESRTNGAEMLAALFAEAPIGLAMIDRDFRFVRVNRCIAELLGATPEAIAGQRFADVTPRGAASFEPHLRRVLQLGEVIDNVEIRWPILGETEIDHARSAQLLPLRDSDGEIVGVALLVPEASQSTQNTRETQAALRQSRYVLHGVVEGTTAVVFAKDGAGRYVLLNNAAVGFLERPRAEMLGRTDSELFEPAVAERIREDDRRVLARDTTQTYEEEIPDSEGKSRVFVTTKGPLRSPDGAVVGVFGISRDITAGRNEELAARAKSETLRGFFDAPGVFMCVFDLTPDESDFVYVMPNSRMAEYHGTTSEQLTGRTGTEVGMAGEQLAWWIDRFRMVRETREPLSFEYSMVRNERTSWFYGSLSAIELNPGSAPAICFVATDITERKVLEERLLQSQKLDSLGRLAGGVAHDFNNLLTVILGNAAFASDTLPRGNPVALELKQINDAGRRAAELTRQLLAFARRQVIEPRPIDLNALTMKVDGLLRRLIGEHIELVTVLAPDLATALADEGQIEQVLVNLAVNARDAMPEGGKLTIETANVRLDRSHLPREAEFIPGDYVMVAISDTGVGIASDQMEHIFEPFFTTKAPGHGTGLGLATVYGIVRQSGGQVIAYSEPGRGATFKVYLARAGRDVEEAEADAPTSVRRGTETILLVEDDHAVRSVALRALRQHGYRVLEATDGSEAIQLAEKFAGAIDLLLTDIVMPQIGGRELARRLTTRRPSLRVLCTSGYAPNAMLRHGEIDDEVAFLPKPYVPQVLLDKVRAVLDQPAPLPRASHGSSRLR